MRVPCCNVPSSPWFMGGTVAGCLSLLVFSPPKHRSNLLAPVDDNLKFAFLIKHTLFKLVRIFFKA